MFIGGAVKKAAKGEKNKKQDAPKRKRREVPDDSSRDLDAGSTAGSPQPKRLRGATTPVVQNMAVGDNLPDDTLEDMDSDDD